MFTPTDLVKEKMKMTRDQKKCVIPTWKAV